MNEEENTEATDVTNGESPAFAFGPTDVQDGKLFGLFESMDQVRDALVRSQEDKGSSENSEGKPQTTDGEETSGGIRIPEATESAGVSQEDLQPFFDEYEKSGTLAEESYAALEAKGLPRVMVDAYIDGQIARRDRDAQKVYQAVGGKEVVDKALAWAQKNLTPERQEAFNKALAGADPETASLMLKGLVSESGVARSGVSPSTSKGTAANPFPNRAAFEEALRDPMYFKSSEYRDKVQARVKASQALGIL